MFTFKRVFDASIFDVPISVPCDLCCTVFHDLPNGWRGHRNNVRNTSISAVRAHVFTSIFKIVQSFRREFRSVVNFVSARISFIKNFVYQEFRLQQFVCSDIHSGFKRLAENSNIISIQSMNVHCSFRSKNSLKLSSKRISNDIEWFEPFFYRSKKNKSKNKQNSV